jgi:transcription-repair coupling factor (superfamily II helicase)
MLGAGFQIAIRDLEIRGAGNLLGAEQSGHIAAVGYEMYCQLLDKAVHDLREGVSPILKDAMVGLGITGRIPKVYISSESRRLAMYRRFAEARELDVLKGVLGDLESAYGTLPDVAKLLVQYHELRIASTKLDVESIMVQEGDVVIRTRDPEVLKRALRKADGSVREVGQRLSSGAIAVFMRPTIGVRNLEAVLLLLRDAFVTAG